MKRNQYKKEIIAGCKISIKQRMFKFNKFIIFSLIRIIMNTTTQIFNISQMYKIYRCKLKNILMKKLMKII